MLEMLGKVQPEENLWDLKRQYQHVFRIDFEKAPIVWDNVIELHEARNCILHSESVADERYRRNVKNPRLLRGNEIGVIGGEDRIVTGRKNFDHCVRVFSQFASFVIKGVAERKGLKKS